MTEAKTVTIEFDDGTKWILSEVAALTYELPGMNRLEVGGELLGFTKSTQPAQITILAHKIAYD